MTTMGEGPINLLSRRQVRTSLDVTTAAGAGFGGQVRLLGYAPIVPSRFGQRHVCGRIVENDRHLIVSGGLGCTGLPVRFGSPPELVMIEVTA